MPSYVRSRLLNAREFAVAELDNLKQVDPVFQLPVIEHLRQVVPFDQYLFGGVDIDGCQTGKSVVLATDMPLDLVKSYQGQGLHSADPLFDHISPDAPHASWFDLTPEEATSPRARPVVQLCDLHALAPRTLFSFWGERGERYGLAVFTRATPFSASEREVLQWVARKLHDDMSKPILRAFNAQVGLNASEQKCLELASRGLTSEDIGEQLGLTTDTINTFIKIATRKLGANNRAQAVADAIRLGIIA